MCSVCTYVAGRLNVVKHHCTELCSVLCMDAWAKLINWQQNSEFIVTVLGMYLHFSCAWSSLYYCGLYYCGEFSVEGFVLKCCSFQWWACLTPPFWQLKFSVVVPRGSYRCNTPLNGPCIQEPAGLAWLPARALGAAWHKEGVVKHAGPERLQLAGRRLFILSGDPILYIQCLGGIQTFWNLWNTEV